MLYVLCMQLVLAQSHVFVVGAGTATESGSTSAVALTSPWESETSLGTVGRAPHVRHADGFHYVVNGAPDHSLQVIDATTFQTVRTIDVGAGSDPRDVAVLSDGTAYVTRYRSAWLLRVDTTTGAHLDSLDLSAFADPDGWPDMSVMARDGDRLFVQLQRRDQITTWDVVPPSMLAVVDLTTHTLVDTDPVASGVQAIPLVAPLPDLDMHIVPGERRLLVSAPGNLLDGRGGIEAIDLDALASLGILMPELDANGDLGAILVVDASKGYFISSTDIIASTHLYSFSPADGSVTSGQLYFSTNYTREMAYDAPSGQLFLPYRDGDGVVVIDVATDEILTETPIPVGPRPVDLVVAREGVVDVDAPGTPSFPPSVGVHPNPTLRGRTVSFPGAVGAARVFDATGRWIREIDAGTAGWDTRNARGRHVSPGVYYVRFDGSGDVRRVVVR